MIAVQCLYRVLVFRLNFNLLGVAIQKYCRRVIMSDRENITASKIGSYEPLRVKLFKFVGFTIQHTTSPNIFNYSAMFPTKITLKNTRKLQLSQVMCVLTNGRNS